MTAETAETDRPEVLAPRTVFDGHTRRVLHPLLRLSLPVMGERAALTLLFAVDALLVGRFVGGAGVAAVGIASLFLWVVLVGASAAEAAATALVARDTGSGDRAGAARALSAAMAVSLLWGVAAACILAAAAPTLMRLMGAEAEVVRLGAQFLRAACIALPFLLLLYTAAGAMRGAGNAVLPMLILLAVNALNLVVTYALISGSVGVSLGVLASGIGYAVGGVAGGLLALLALARGGSGVRYPAAGAPLMPARPALRRFLRLAVPLTAEEIQFMVAFLLYTRIVAGEGTTAAAAHTIALRMVDIAVILSFGVGTAATALVGQALGLGRADLAAAVTRVASWVVLALMLAFGLALALAGGWLAALFVDDPAVIDTATRLIRVFVFALPGIGLAIVIGGALRGAGDVRFAFVAALCCTWLLRLPTAWLCGVVLGWGPPGAWVGAVAENTVRAAVMLARFRGGRWQRMRV